MSGWGAVSVKASPSQGTSLLADSSLEDQPSRGSSRPSSRQDPAHTSSRPAVSELDVGNELAALRREEAGKSSPGVDVGVRLEMLEHMLIEERNARRAMEGMVQALSGVAQSGSQHTMAGAVTDVWMNIADELRGRMAQLEQVVQDERNLRVASEDDLDSHLDQLQTTDRDVEGQISSLDNGLAGMRTSALELGAQIKKVEDEMKANKSSMALRLSGFDDLLDNFEGRLQTVEKQIHGSHAVQTSLADAEDGLEVLRAAQTANQRELTAQGEALHTCIDSVESAATVAFVTQSVESLSNRVGEAIDKLGMGVEQANSWVAHAENTVERLELLERGLDMHEVWQQSVDQRLETVDFALGESGPHAQHKNDFAVVMESLSEMEAAVEGLRQGAEKMVESKIAATLLSRNSDASQSRQSKLGKYPGGAPVPRQAKVNAIAAAKFSKG